MHERDEIRVVEEIAQLGFDVAVVDVDRDGAQLVRGEDGLHESVAIEAVDPDVVAGLDTLGLEMVGETVCPFLELGVGAGLVGDDHCDPIGDRVDDVLDEICDVPGHDSVVEHQEPGQCETAAVDVDLPAEDDPRRVDVRGWFTEHPAPSPGDLVDAGYVVPHWPRPYGLDADPALQLIIEDEMRRAGVAKPMNPIGIGHCGPIIVALGDDAQKDRYLSPMLRGEELWCQLFSEPGAGSDLANLSTRAERDGDVYRVNGQKIWTSLADHAKFGILIARTRNDVSKHRGISYFIVSMDLPGIEVRPIRNMTGESGFNEVFFTDVRVPAENLIGEENLGWGMAKSTLANERVSLSTGGGLQWGYGPARAISSPTSATAADSATSSRANRWSVRSSKARSCATTA